MSKKRAGDIYLKVIAGAFVTIPEKSANPKSGKILVKVDNGAGGEDLLGFYFDQLHIVDSVMTALHRVRAEMTKDDKVHPMLKGPTDGRTH